MQYTHKILVSLSMFVQFDTEALQKVLQNLTHAVQNIGAEALFGAGDSQHEEADGIQF